MRIFKVQSKEIFAYYKLKNKVSDYTMNRTFENWAVERSNTHSYSFEEVMYLPEELKGFRTCESCGYVGKDVSTRQDNYASEICGDDSNYTKCSLCFAMSAAEV